MRIERPVILNHIVSPYGIAGLSTFFFLLAWTFPPSLYAELVYEPDLMFLDPGTLLFFLFCVAGFWVGLLLIDFLFPASPLLQSQQQSIRLKGFALLLPLMVTTVMTAFAGMQMLKEAPNLLVLLFAQQGATVKSEFSDFKLGVLGWGVAMHMAVLWWTYWKLSNSRLSSSKRPRDRRIFSWLIFALGIVAQLGISFLRVSRSDLMPAIGGLAVLYLMGKILRGEIKTTGLVWYVLLFPLGVISVFVAFGLIRGAGDLTTGLGSFIEYTFASYNRLTALLHGRMHYPYGGRGIYIFSFLIENNFLRSLIPTDFGWPDYFNLWNSEFQAPQLAGLNSYLIWSGAFGYLFSELGWGTPLILFIYGVAYGVVWRQAKSGTALGLTLYPWFAFSALSWFASNLAFSSHFPFFFVAGLILMGYEKLCRWFSLSVIQTKYASFSFSGSQ